MKIRLMLDLKKRPGRHRLESIGEVRWLGDDRFGEALGTIMHARVLITDTFGSAGICITGSANMFLFSESVVEGFVSGVARFCCFVVQLAN